MGEAAARMVSIPLPGNSLTAAVHSPPSLPYLPAGGSPADALTPCAYHKMQEHGVTEQNMQFSY